MSFLSGWGEGVPSFEKGKRRESSRGFFEGPAAAVYGNFLHSVAAEQQALYLLKEENSTVGGGGSGRMRVKKRKSITLGGRGKVNAELASKGRVIPRCTPHPWRRKRSTKRRPKSSPVQGLSKELSQSQRDRQVSEEPTSASLKVLETLISMARKNGSIDGDPV